jgi:hypothetical protein
MSYVRTCQECGHKQESRPPAEYKGESWKHIKCHGCKSYGLDYGSHGWVKTESGTFVKPEDEED